MKKHFLIVIILAVFACKKTETTELELLSKREMVDVLIDIHILEAKVNKLRLQTDSSKAIYNSLEDELFENKEVDKGLYERSYQHYLVNTKEMQEIYGVVVDSLNLRHQRSTMAKETDIVAKPQDLNTPNGNKIAKPTGLDGASKAMLKVKAAQIDSSKLK